MKKTLIASAGFIALAGMAAAGGFNYGGGAGGTVPPDGGTGYSGGGSTWPDLSGLTPFVSTINVADNYTIASLDHVTFEGLFHTWGGDLHAVLVSPNGTDVTIFHRPGFTGTGFGNSNDFDGGNYRFEATGAELPDTTAMPAGTYGQDLGAWTNDTDTFAAFNGENVNGTWTLLIYDWAAGDTGSMNGWSFGFTAVPTPGALALLGLAGLASRRRRRA